MGAASSPLRVVVMGGEGTSRAGDPLPFGLYRVSDSADLESAEAAPR